MAAIIAVKRSLLLPARTYFGATERTAAHAASFIFIWADWIFYFSICFVSFSSFFFIFQREERSLLIGFVGKNVRARGNVIVDGRVFNGKVLAKSDLILLQ